MSHKHKYKNVGLDSQELRRRREEEGIQLRKQKREQQLIKRRNVNIAQEEEEVDSTIHVSKAHWSAIVIKYLHELNVHLFLIY